MKEMVIDAIVWGVGAVVVLSLLTAAIGALALVAVQLSRVSAERIMRFVRYETARYWVGRMEREGLTVVQSEYRRMVAERNPKTHGDFQRLSRDCPLSAEQATGTPEKGN